MTACPANWYHPIAATDNDLGGTSLVPGDHKLGQKNAEPRESKDESECGLSDGQVHVRQFEGQQRHLQVQDQRVEVPDVSLPGHGWPLDKACLGKALDHGVNTDGDAGDCHVLPRELGMAD